MAYALAIVIGISLVAGLIVYAVRYAKEVEKWRHQMQANEHRRLEECRGFIHEFARCYPEIEANALSKHELESKAIGGAQKDELIKFIKETVSKSDLFRLGAVNDKFLDLPVILSDDIRDKHVYVIGKSGFGKTTFLRHMIAKDLERGNGLAVLAPEAELLTDEILPIIPDNRIDDVIYFNPADIEMPVVLNPLQVRKDENIDVHVDETFTVLRRLTDEGGPRMNHILQFTLSALVERPGSTLLDVGPLLDRKNPAFRNEIIQTTADDLTRQFFENEYPQMPADAHLPILTRLGRIIRAQYVRNCLCPPHDTALTQEQIFDRTLDIRKAMDQGKILLFNLSDGILGQDASLLIGQLIVAKFQTATMSRAALAKSDRRRFYLYLDEFQNFCGVAKESYEKILSRARKYNLGLILAHQQTSQLPIELMREILGNVSTKIAFQLSHHDALILAKEIYGAYGSKADVVQSFMNLKVGETVCSVAGIVRKMNTPKVSDTHDRQKVKRIIERSREQYGIPRVFQKTSGTTKEKPQDDWLKDLDAGDVFA